MVVRYTDIFVNHKRSPRYLSFEFYKLSVHKTKLLHWGSGLYERACVLVLVQKEVNISQEMLYNG